MDKDDGVEVTNTGTVLADRSLNPIVLLGFAVIAAATYLSTTIVLPVTFLVAFLAYAVRYVPFIPFDSPDRTVFVAYFLAIGVLIAH
jgi:hypothetical protein